MNNHLYNTGFVEDSKFKYFKEEVMEYGGYKNVDVFKKGMRCFSGVVEQVFYKQMYEGGTRLSAWFYSWSLYR